MFEQLYFIVNFQPVAQANLCYAHGTSARALNPPSKHCLARLSDESAHRFIPQPKHCFETHQDKRALLIGNQSNTPSTENTEARNFNHQQPC
jgi:hypothetical protein